jgi:hypothetical protein
MCPACDTREILLSAERNAPLAHATA